MPTTATLFWYDYETFGISPARDRIAQFGGLRTDEQLKIIGEPLQLYCKPSNDFLPDPDACLLTGITPQIALAHGLCEAEFIQRIHAEMAHPHTCTLGYNNLRFDDEFTRYALYRNFFDPYEREWKQGNSRWDIIDMVRLCYALRPEGIQWPVHDDGSPSFKLEDLTVANGIEHQGAHDALTDVYATLNLARLVKRQQPRLYDYLYQQRNKHKIAEQLDLLSRPALVHTSRMYSAHWGCTSLIMPLAQHPTNKNEIIVYDLRSDPQPLLTLDADSIRERLFTRTDELPEDIERIPLKTIHINKCPVLAPLSTVREEDAQRIELDVEKCLKHRAEIKRHSADLSSKLQAVFSPKTFAHEDVDQMLYVGFFNDKDKRKMEQVRRQAPETLSQLKLDFEDPRLPELLFRYRARNYPHSLSAAEQQRWTTHRWQRLNSSDNGLAYPDYLLRLRELQTTQPRNARQQQTLQQLTEYAEQLAPAQPV